MFSNPDQQNFLANYWQQKPLLLRAFIPDFVDTISPDILAGLACEDFVESRLISNPDDSDNWRLRHGPFAEQDFEQLPDSNWTLLVQAVDQWHRETAQLLAHFDFLPSWRIDDIMVSFATDNAGVGPHYDHYDVFLLQGAGARKWRLGGKCDGDTKWRGDSELRLLEEFASEQEYILQPGDVLYVPPGYAHYGTSVGDSLCYSIGFRSPSQAEQIQGFSDEIIDSLAEHKRYVDPNPGAIAASGEILASALDQAHSELQQLIGDKQAFLAWFGRYVTLPKYPELVMPMELNQHQFDNTGLSLAISHNPSSRFAFTQLADQVLLFVDGEKFVLPLERLVLVQYFCAGKSFSVKETQSFTVHTDFRALIKELLSRGSLLVQQSPQ